MKQADRRLFIFTKPALHSLQTKKKSSEVYYPYARSLFTREDAFDVYIIDGGAFFFMNEFFGGAKARHLLEAWKQHTLFTPWTVKQKINWTISSRQAQKHCLYEREKQAWISRLYFLLPWAAEFLKTNDEKWAKTWLFYWKKWMKENPCPVKASAAERRYQLVWFDMQICWRLLVMIHSVFLLAGSQSLCAEDWQKLYKTILAHAEKIFEESQKHLAENSGRGNHFLQQGTALIFTGVLFPEFKKSGDFIKTGRQIIEQQMRTEILSDGCSIETSPSYGHFIARLYIDVWALLKYNGHSSIPGLTECIRRQYIWLYHNAAPDMRTQQINDSYAMDVKKDLEIVSSLFSLAKPGARKTMIFSKSNFIIIRKSEISVYIDASSSRLYHQHYGKPSVLVWINNHPFLIDSGCVNYDRQIRQDYLVRSIAHNTVFFPEFSEQKLPASAGNAPRIKITSFQETKTFCRAVIDFQHSEKKLTCRWRREIYAENRHLQITDRITFNRTAAARQIFHFAGCDIVPVPDQLHADIFFRGKNIRMIHSHKGIVEYTAAVNEHNQTIFSPQFSIYDKSKNIIFKTSFLF